MAIERPARRMTLRQLLTHSEKCVRDLIEHVQSMLMTHLIEFRDLSRPVRRRSHYPTMLALGNVLKKLLQSNQEAEETITYLQEQLQEIREHAQRERVNRL
ncbi:MAG: hypothetical protein L0Z62_33665 [Gemmataceae bacterium]|nr:hypothetical protein [Gemmataceae bacterium]